MPLRPLCRIDGLALLVAPSAAGHEERPWVGRRAGPRTGMGKKGTTRRGPPEGVRNCEISIKFASKTRNVREANLQGGRDDSKVAAVGGQGKGKVI